MCGRFALGAHREAIMGLEGYPQDPEEWVDEDDFQPRYNVAPRTRAPVLRRVAGGGGRRATDGSDRLVLQTMKWGVIPHWSKDEKTSSNLNTINARAENLLESSSGMWNQLKAKKRCALVCDGYFEWLVKGKHRLPHFTKRSDGRLLILACLFDSVVLEGTSEILSTFSIVTTSASSKLSWLHDRMPVILDESNLDRWLDASKGWHKGLFDILVPYTGDLECYAGKVLGYHTTYLFTPVRQVPPEVGKVGAQDASFIQPLSQRKGGIAAMFANQADRSSPSKSQISPSKAISLKTSRPREEEVPAEVAPPPAKKKKVAHVTTTAPPESPLKGKAAPENRKITQFFAKDG